MNRDDKRFEKIYSQGTLSPFEVWVDRETGVQYIYKSSGYSAIFQPLLDKDGKPLTMDINDIDRLNK